MPRKPVKPIVMTEGRTPWDIQKGEGAIPFRAFRLYLELGEARSHQKVAELLGVQNDNIRRMSMHYHWTERVRAFEAHSYAERGSSILEEQEKLTKQHKALISNIRTGVQAPVMIMIEKMRALMKENGTIELKELDGLTPLEVLDRVEPYIKHLPMLIRTERLLAGLPTEIMEGHVKQEISIVKKEFREYILNTPDERIAEIIKRAKARLAGSTGKH